MKPAQVSFKIIKQEIDSLSLDAAVRLGLRLAFLALGSQLLVLALAWLRLPPQVPLLYSRAYGESQLVGRVWLWLLPALTFVCQLISIRLATLAGSENRLWSQLVSGATAVTAAMGLVTLAKIILLVV